MIKINYPAIISNREISYTLSVMLIVMFITGLSAQESGTWGVSISSAYSQPIGGLTNWFKPDFSSRLTIGKQYNENWFIEGMLEYDHFTKENLSGYIRGKLNLSLEHIGILVGGRHKFIQNKIVQPYFNLAAGVYHWIGVRGAIAADSTVFPFIPSVDKRKLEETNWGFCSGIGMEIKFIPSLGIDLQTHYRLIFGDLWPTLQPGIELEGVSGFQTLNYRIAIRYYFK